MFGGDVLVGLFLCVFVVVGGGVFVVGGGVIVLDVVVLFMIVHTANITILPATLNFAKYFLFGKVNQP